MVIILSFIDKFCDIDRDGFLVNWNRDEFMFYFMFRLILLSRGDLECDWIYCDMEKVGLYVVKVERLQNLDFLEKFKFEIRYMFKRKDFGMIIENKIYQVFKICVFDCLVFVVYIMVVVLVIYYKCNDY